MTSEPILLTGNAHPALATAVARQLGFRLSPSAVERFPDGEVGVELQESVRRREVFIIQPTSPPAADHLLELVVLADACRRAAADRLVAVLPYFGYGRSDRRGRRRQPVMASAVAAMLEGCGIDHVIVIDVHAPQVDCFFRIPVESLSAVGAIAAGLQAALPLDVVIVAPDAGALRLAGEYAVALGAPVAALHKERWSPSRTEALHLIGDVKDRPCLIVDDIIATGGTMISAVRALLEAGAAPEISLAATHGLFVGDARDKLDLVEPIRRVVVSDSTPHPDREWAKLRLVSVVPLVADAIARVSGFRHVRQRGDAPEPWLATSLS